MAFLAQVSTQQLITKSISTLTLNVSSITGVVLGAVSPADITSTIQGLGSIGYISTSQLTSTVAGIGSGFTGSTTFLSAATVYTSSMFANFMLASTIQASNLSSQTVFTKTAFLTSTITSTLLINGTGIAKWNGTNSASLYGSGVDTFTLQTSSNANQAGIASLAFATNTASYPLGRIYALDSAASGSPISQLIFQNVPTSPTTFTSNFSYTGSGQTFTVPAGVTTMQISLWGAGGGGNSVSGYGGAGAFSKGVLNVTPGQVYTIVVGQGGPWGTVGAAYGGGGASGAGGYSQGSGGGRTAIQLNLTSVISSASGSGTAITYTTSVNHGLIAGQPVIISGLSPSGFNGTYVVSSTPASNQFVVSSSQSGSSSGTGSILAEVVNTNVSALQFLNLFVVFAKSSGTSPAVTGAGGGGGGTLTGGGAAGSNSGQFGQAGSLLQGGAGYYNSGAGGGGYYGGGGGPGNSTGGGGGGSSYTSHTSFALTLGENSPNSQEQAPGASVSGYVTGVAKGGTTGAGGSGYVILNSIGGSITEAMRIGSNGYLGLGTTTPSYQLDVAGNARMSNAYLGTNSTLITQQFYGLFGAYNNTVLAEISTGGGTQELLVFKGSSASDRVRVQTTGTFIIETGVSARLWSTNTAITSSNVTPAFIVNTSSNVGIQTANPQATLDVAGTGRFQIISTQQFFASSIQTPFISTQRLLTSSIQTPFISTQRLLASSVATAFLSTAGLNASSIFTPFSYNLSTLTSTLIVNGSEIVKYNGSASASLYGYGTDTLTLQYTSNNYVGAVASLAFAGNAASYPLARIYALDSAASGSPISQLVFQNTPLSATSFNSNFSYTGANQTFTVPTGVTSMQISLWGAGGAGGYNGGGGGAGAFVQGTLTVSAGQTYTIVVGQGGVMNSASSTYGGGGGSGGGNPGGSSGGGRSAILLNLTVTVTSASGSGSAITFTTSGTHGLLLGQPIVISGLSPSGFNGNFAVASILASNQFTALSTQSGSSTGTGSILAEIANAGGGGSGGYNNGLGGAAQFSGTSLNAPDNGGFRGGKGGTQTAGGAGGAGSTWSGSILQGGLGLSLAGGGGGGFYGGGGGEWAPGGAAGGGGGSTYTSHTSFSLIQGLNSPNSQNQAPGTSITGYQAGVAVGGTSFQTGSSGNGGNGLVLLNSVGGSMAEAMRIGTNGYIGIGTTNPSYQLDVAGNARLSNAYLGTNSTLITQQFYGLFGAYNNTVLAEISTGGGTQELLVFKGSSASDRVRVQTTGSFVIETGVSARLWSTNTAITSSNVTPALVVTTSSNVGIQIANPQTALDVAGTGRFLTLSTLALNISSINGTVYSAGGGGITTANLQSTVGGLGQIYLSTAGSASGSVPYISAFTVSTGSLNVSSLNALTLNVSTNATISSLIVNSLQFGDGTGWVNLGPLQTVAISSIQENTNALYTNNAYFGNVSTVNALQFNGLFSNYNNTVLAEISTGGGTQELLVFKGSSTSDRVRVQTTGSFVIETGVSARLWNSNTTQTLSNVTPAFIINSSSNVGIQTATPGTALDVAGIGRFLTLSTLALNLSSINGTIYTAASGGSSGPVPYISALTVSTGSVFASSIVSFTMSSLQIFASSIVAPYTFAPQFITF